VAINKISSPPVERDASFIPLHHSKELRFDMDFNLLLVAGIPLVIVIFGLVEMVKSLGLQGHWLTVTSLLIGLSLGLGYKIAEAGLPTGFAGWFAVIIFGLTLGLVASGFYKWSDARFPKSSTELP
jgi:hypothetical protein